MFQTLHKFNILRKINTPHSSMPLNGGKGLNVIPQSQSDSEDPVTS